jgi:hypothetical protein
MRHSLSKVQNLPSNLEELLEKVPEIDRMLGLW